MGACTPHGIDHRRRVRSVLLGDLASLDGLDSEDLYISLFATLIVAPFSIAGAAVVLRLRRNVSDFEVRFATALVIFAEGSVLGLIGFVAVHLNRPG